MAISQKQIAQKLGVSIALVSRVLSGKAAEIGIAPDTIARVVKTAEAMGYVPSAAALSLKGKSTRTIGVAVYDFNDPFFGALIKQIQIQAHEHDYSLILAGFLNRTPDEQDLQSLRKYALDGLIVIGTDLDTDWLSRFQNTPAARIGHGSPAEQSVRVTVDEEHAARQLITHLLETGRKQLVYASANLSSHRIRQAAFLKVAKSCGVELITPHSPERDAFAAGMQIANALRGTADALVCATDQVAIGALHTLHNAGLDVPGRIAITGFDGIPAAAQFIPPLTTIRQPLQEMVQLAFQSIVTPTAPQTITLPGTLMIRETT